MENIYYTFCAQEYGLNNLKTMSYFKFEVMIIDYTEKQLIYVF